MPVGGAYQRRCTAYKNFKTRGGALKSMQIVVDLDPRDRRSKKLIKLLRELGEPETSPRRSYHPLDLLSEVISSSLDKFASLVRQLVAAWIKPRKGKVSRE
jgi:hypothetical protein